MGNKQSKVKTPYEVFNIEPTSTKNEIRSAYIKLMLLHHPTRQKKSDPQKAVDITNAYTTIKSSPPLFEYYTEELFKKDFMKYAADFYERIGDFCGIVSPDFTTNHIEVYKTFNRFRLYKCARKFKNENEKNLFCFNVLKVSNILKKLDDRIVKEDTKVLEKPVASSVTVERKPNIKPYCCNECKKNFKSKNQLINHYNSKKHYLAVEEMVEDPKLFVQRQIQSIEDISFEEEEGKNLKDEITDIFEHLTLQKKLSSYEDVLENPEISPVLEKEEDKSSFKKEVKPIRGEPAVFRTCSKCKSIFENRITLLKHIKESHT